LLTRWHDYCESVNERKQLRCEFASKGGRKPIGKVATECRPVLRGHFRGGFFYFFRPVRARTKGSTMYQDTIDFFAESAARKAQAISTNPLGFFIACLMAGAYIGLGIIAIFSIGQGVEAAYRPLAMGLTFAIALTLVVFAGAELFTGHTMIMTVGLVRGTVGVGSVAKSWALTWVGNLIGAALLALLFWLGGGGAILKQGADLIFTASAAKMHAAPMALLARGVLCNWLVCLALWMSARK
jgi:nitrite transporter NirC